MPKFGIVNKQIREIHKDSRGRHYYIKGKSGFGMNTTSNANGNFAAALNSPTITVQLQNIENYEFKLKCLLIRCLTKIKSIFLLVLITLFL